VNPNPQGEQPMQQPGWFSRNWKWLLPVGCMVPLVCCGGISAIAYFGATTMIQGSGAFTESMSKVNQNPEVAAALGSPVTPGFGTMGSFNQNNNSGTADFTVPLKGPNGEGSVHVVARLDNGRWEFSRIDVVAGGKTIDVLAAEKKKNDPPDEAEDSPDEEEPAGD